jgi:hypothetical protein
MRGTAGAPGDATGAGGAVAESAEAGAADTTGAGETLVADVEAGAGVAAASVADV